MPTNGAGRCKPGDFVHDMSIRLTLDHSFTIVDVEAVTDKSPYRICGDVAPDFKKLIGLAHRRRLPPRGARAAGRRAWLHAHRRAAGPGGDHGVPDRVVAQGARPQTGPSHQDRQAAQARTIPPQAAAQALHASTPATPGPSDGEVTKRWVPQFYTGPDAEAVRAAAKRQGNRDGRLTSMSSSVPLSEGLEDRYADEITCLPRASAS